MKIEHTVKGDPRECNNTFLDDGFFSPSELLEATTLINQGHIPLHKGTNELDYNFKG